jgi:hypothetical protein
MSPLEDMVPPPSVVRERLAQNLEEARTLRRLLRLSARLAEHRRERPSTRLPKAPGHSLDRPVNRTAIP